MSGPDTLAAPQALDYAVDAVGTPPKVASIRGVDLPEGVLYTPIDVLPEDRVVTDRAIQMVAGLFRWAREARRDGEE